MVAMVPVALLAYAFFGFNVLSLGLRLCGFLRQPRHHELVARTALDRRRAALGLGRGELCVAHRVRVAACSCVYYPLTTLPGWLQPVALALPPTYVFEGLRAIVNDGVFLGGYMLCALALNAVYFAACYGAFRYFLHSARVNGSLVQMGE